MGQTNIPENNTDESTDSSANSPSEIEPKILDLKDGKEEVVELKLQVNGDLATTDDLFFILEFDSGELDKANAKVQLQMMNLLDKLIIGGLRGKAIPLKFLPDVMKAVGEALNRDDDIKN